MSQVIKLAFAQLERGTIFTCGVKSKSYKKISDGQAESLCDADPNYRYVDMDPLTLCRPVWLQPDAADSASRELA